MGSVFMLLAFIGLFLYGLSWGVTNPGLSVSMISGYVPILGGYGSCLLLMSLFLGSGLDEPLLGWGVVDFSPSSWDVMEMGALGALVVGSLPFFVLSQSSPSSVAGPTALSGLVSLAAGLTFMSTTSLWVMFMSFEFLLLSAMYMLLLTSKSESVSDAALEMFIWTLLGSAGLLTGLGLIGGFSVGIAPHSWGLLAGICFITGFGVKVPLWPATSWLLKAHVEASVEFSILLSGYMVKIGVLGLYSTLVLAESPTLNLLASSLAVVGLFDAGSSMPAQSDMKSMVALTTVMEMNWAVLAFSLGGAQLDSVAGYLCLAHCCTTATEFFLVEVLTKSFGTRDVSYLGGLALSAPSLWLMSVLGVLVTMGFPGTSLFWAKYVFFVGLVQTLPGLAVALGFLFLVFLPIFFMSLWAMVWFGLSMETSLMQDLSLSEASVLAFAMGLGLLLGLMPGLIFWNTGGFLA